MAMYPLCRFLHAVLIINFQNDTFHHGQSTHNDGITQLPAAMVSPPRRINILPISLLFVNVSRGIPRGTAAEPDT